MLFEIGGLWFYCKGDNPYFEERSKAFRREDSEKIPEECDFKVDIKMYKNLRKPRNVSVDGLQDSAILRKKPPSQGYYIYSLSLKIKNGKRQRGGNPAILDANSDWTNIKIKQVRNDSEHFTNEDGSVINLNQYSSFLSMGVAFRYMLIKKNGLQIHCSSIDYIGKGIIFSAPSGTGKSTHVKLWQQLYGDEVTIVNEDRPAIRYIDGIPMLCGTPWSGTSDNFANKIVPLSMIIMLEQAPVNTIERLTGVSVLQHLMPRCFLPYFDSELMTEAMNTLERLVKDVPVYLLKCRPDYEAVELVHRCLT